MQGLVASDPPPTSIVRYAPLPSMSALIGGRYVYIRIGALSGAAAIAMHLYYSNRTHQELLRKDYRLEDIDVAKTIDSEHQRMFDTTNLFHFVHSVVLLSVPLMRMPRFVSSFASGPASLFHFINVTYSFRSIRPSTDWLNVDSRYGPFRWQRLLSLIERQLQCVGRNRCRNMLFAHRLAFDADLDIQKIQNINKSIQNIITSHQNTLLNVRR